MKISAIFVLMALSVVSCKKDKSTIRTPKFKNIVILGNSITFSAPDLNGEWKGSWGMAASAADSDYVHLLTARFKLVDSNCKVTARNITGFEKDYVNFNFDGNLKDLRDSVPDLLILRIGENVQPSTYNAETFKARYIALIDYFIAKNGKLSVLGVGPLWNAYLVEPVMKGQPYVSLARINQDKSNTAYGLFTDPGIQIHPNNKGMRAISDAIWSGLEKLKPVQ